MCYKQHRTNLKLLKERNLGLTASGSLTEEVLQETNLRRRWREERKRVITQSRRERFQVIMNSSRENRDENKMRDVDSVF